MGRELIARAREAMAGTTPGPWVWKRPKHWPHHETEEGDLGGFFSGDVDIFSFGHNEHYYPTEGAPPKEADGHFIERAHDDFVPNLCAALEAALDKIDRIKKAGYIDAKGNRHE